MRSIRLSGAYRAVFAATVLASIFSNAFAIGHLPVPPECSSTKKVKLLRANHPDKFDAYGKVDLFCGDSKTAMASSMTLCDSDYDANNPLQKTVTIAVASSAKPLTKEIACTGGAEPKFIPKAAAR